MGSGRSKGKLKKQEISSQKENLVSMKEYLISINSEGGGEDHKNSSDSAQHILNGAYTIQTESVQQQAYGFNRNTNNDPPNQDSQKQSYLQTEEKRAPSFQCPIHSHRKIELINTNPSKKQILFCFECAFEQNCGKELIKLSDLLNDPSIFTKSYNQANNYEHKVIYTFMLNQNSVQEQGYFDYMSQYLLETKNYLNPYYDEWQQKLDNLKKEFNSIMSNEAEFQKECRNCFLENHNDPQKFEKQILTLVQQRESLSKDLIICSKIIQQSLIIVQSVQKNAFNQLRNLKSFSQEYKQKKDLDNIKLMFNKELIFKSNLFSNYHTKLADGITIYNSSNFSMKIRFNHKEILGSNEKYQIDMEYQQNETDNIIVNYYVGSLQWTFPIKIDLEKGKLNSLTFYIDAQKKFIKFKWNGNWYNIDLDNYEYCENDQFSIEIKKQSTIKFKSLQKVMAFII